MNQPTTTLTDQYVAMAKAIYEVFSQSKSSFVYDIFIKILPSVRVMYMIMKMKIKGHL
jgi:hypothetical protein